VVDYALGDRGSVDIVTDDYYEAETLQIFEELHIDRERIWYGEARLVPEPDNPYEPNSIAVYIDEFKVGRMSPADSAAYWDSITRVVASGYEPIAHLQLSAVAVRAEGGGMHVKSTGVLSLSAPGSLFPLNDAPTRATLLPQGPSMKVLDEKEHSEYLHSILPPSGEGRVILTLEANQLKTSDGRFVDSVEVRHDRKLVGRLSTQMSEQLAPVIRYAFENDRLTSAWGTIRGNTLELSLTVQAGGNDLTFPHHDLGAGHSWAVSARPHAKHYAHTGMVGLDGHKMSKSRGNLVLVSRLRAAGEDANAVRLAIMGQHYRSDWFWTDELLEHAKARLDTYRHAVSVAEGREGSEGVTDEAAVELLTTVREALGEDLNAPAALAAVDAWAVKALADTTVGGGALVRDILAARLGVVL